MGDSEKGSSGASEGRKPEPTDDQIAFAIRGIAFDCGVVVRAEIARLNSLLPLMEDALTYRAIEGWRSMRSIMESLADGEDTEAITQKVSSESRFYKNPAAVYELLAGLKYWKTQGYALNQDSLVSVFDFLTHRLADDMKFIEDF